VTQSKVVLQGEQASGMVKQRLLRKVIQILQVHEMSNKHGTALAKLCMSLWATQLIMHHHTESCVALLKLLHRGFQEHNSSIVCSRVQSTLSLFKT